MSAGVSGRSLEGARNSPSWPRTKYQRAARQHKTNNTYVFGLDDLEEEVNTDQSEAVELSSRVRARGPSKSSTVPKPKQKTEEIFIEVTINKGDSLLSIALKYGCQAAELKRINNLISDQDFYGLSSIKVPAKRHGLLTELVKKENETMKNGTKLRLGADPNCDGVISLENDDSDISDYGDDTDSTHLLQGNNVRTVSIRGAMNPQGGAAIDFLQKMDKDIKSIVTSTKSRLDSLDEVKTRLTCRRFYPLESKKSVGADCGIRFWSILVAIVIICGVTPLFYLIFYEFFNPKS